MSFAPHGPSVPPKAKGGELVGFDTGGDGSVVAVTRSSSRAGLLTTVYDVASGRVLLEDAHAVSLLTAPAPGRSALVGGPGLAVEVVDLDTRKRRALGKVKGWARAIGGLAWRIEGEKLVSYDLATGKAKASVALPQVRFGTPGAHAPSFLEYFALADGRTLAWLDARFRLTLLDLEKGSAGTPIAGGPREVPARLLPSRDRTRALAIGAKGAAVVFDLAAGQVAHRHDRLVPGPPKNLTWLDDGRVVVESRFLDVIDMKTGKRRTVGKRDPNREEIRAIVALSGSLVLVLVARITDPKEPFLTTSMLEIWDVDAQDLISSTPEEGLHAPLHLTEGNMLFGTILDDGLTLATTWCARTSRAASAKKPSAKKPSAKKPSGPRVPTRRS